MAPRRTTPPSPTPATPVAAPPSPATRRVRPRKPPPPSAPPVKRKRGPKKPRPAGAGARGPLPTKLDWKVFDALAEVHATAEELAAYFRCSVDTIERAVLRDKGSKLAEYLNEKQGTGRVSLRRKQFQKALKGQGDRVMLIWLGKQYLGQRDKREHVGEGGGPIKLQHEHSDEALLAKLRAMKDRTPPAAVGVTTGTAAAGTVDTHVRAVVHTGDIVRAGG